MSSQVADRQSRSRARSIPRAEMVGSLLKPPQLLELFREVYAGVTAQERLVPPERLERLEELRRMAREASRDVVGRLEDIGMDVVGDGEMRRGYFLNGLYDGVTGLGLPSVSDLQLFGLEPRVQERLRLVSNPLADELAFLRSLTARPVKAALPAPSIFHMRGYLRDPEAYADSYEYIEDVVSIERAMVAEAAAEGATYVQFDYPIYTTLADPDAEMMISSPWQRVFDHSLRSDAAVVEGLPAHVTTAIHLNRGNFKSTSIVQGALDPVAERVFGELPHDRFLVEWNNVGEMGGFETIRFVPKGKIVVLGLVSAHDARVETVDELLRRIDEAQRQLPIEQLAISPGCGFASSYEGNENVRDVMWRKLELVAEVADRVWPR
jgi:5-methyltetrahydropteroyltriglutamate--homocysteine methyltransferase